MEVEERKRGKERAAITDGRGAESATQQENHGRARSAVRVLQCDRVREGL